VGENLTGPRRRLTCNYRLPWEGRRPTIPRATILYTAAFRFGLHRSWFNHATWRTTNDRRGLPAKSRYFRTNVLVGGVFLRNSLAAAPQFQDQRAPNGTKDRNLPCFYSVGKLCSAGAAFGAAPQEGYYARRRRSRKGKKKEAAHSTAATAFPSVSTLGTGPGATSLRFFGTHWTFKGIDKRPCVSRKACRSKLASVPGHGAKNTFPPRSTSRLAMCRTEWTRMQIDFPSRRREGQRARLARAKPGGPTAGRENLFPLPAGSMRHVVGLLRPSACHRQWAPEKKNLADGRPPG